MTPLVTLIVLLLGVVLIGAVLSLLANREKEEEPYWLDVKQDLPQEHLEEQPYD